jgi:hypothetical protein
MAATQYKSVWPHRAATQLCPRRHNLSFDYEEFVDFQPQTLRLVYEACKSAPKINALPTTSGEAHWEEEGDEEYPHPQSLT